MRKVCSAVTKVLAVLLMAGLTSCQLQKDDSPQQLRGVVIYPSDLISLGEETWVKMMKENDLNLLGIHTDTKFETLPKLKIYLESERGMLLQQLCKENDIAIEYELHVLQDVLPREHFAAHPEYFRADAEGERQQAFNMCFSSEGAYSEIEKNIREICTWLKPVTNRYFFWTDDVNHAFCECEHCAKYTPSEQALLFENRLLAMLKKINPEAQLAHLAYNRTLPAPEQVKPAEGVFLEYAPINRDYSKPLSAEHQKDLEQNLKVFPAGTAHILEYWLDVSMFSHWKKDQLVKLPMTAEMMQRDVELYQSYGIPSITSFGAWINADYRNEFGTPHVEQVFAEYGAAFERDISEGRTE